MGVVVYPSLLFSIIFQHCAIVGLLSIYSTYAIKLKWFSLTALGCNTTTALAGTNYNSIAVKVKWSDLSMKTTFKTLRHVVNLLQLNFFLCNLKHKKHLQ